jgi:guanylate kinase
MVAKFPPVILAGVSGSGKNAIITQLLKTGNYHYFVTCTTRLPRENDGVMEKEGVDYYFLSTDQARDMLERQAFVEAKFVHGTIYGTSVAEYERAVRADKIPIFDVDVQGVMEYKAITPSTTALFVLPPSYEVWLERLKKRFSDEEEFLAAWPKRRESAIRELEAALESHQFEWIINDDLDESAEVAKQLIASPSTDFVTKEQKQIAKDLLAKLKTE